MLIKIKPYLNANKECKLKANKDQTLFDNLLFDTSVDKRWSLTKAQQMTKTFRNTRKAFD